MEPSQEKAPPRLVDLTERNMKAILAANPPAGKGLYLWDRQLKGFGIRVNAGGSVSFVFKARVGSKQLWKTLGDWPATKCAEARTAAEVLRGRIKDGEAPVTPKVKSILWEELLEKFEAEHLPGLKATSRASYQSVLDVHLRPAFRRRMAHEIDDGDIRAFHRSLAGIPRQANVALMILNLIFERAEGWRFRTVNTNPVAIARKAGLKPFPEGMRDRQLTDVELERLGAALERMEGEGHRQFCDLVRLLLLSGARLREVMALRWEQIDERARTIRWKDSKTGKVSKPLNDALFEVLAKLPREEGKPWVFPSEKTDGCIQDVKRPWRRLLELAEIEDLHRHDLRHLHGNAAAELGLNLQTIAALLGHRQTSTTERYSKVGEDPRLAASNQVSGALKRKLKGAK